MTPLSSTAEAASVVAQRAEEFRVEALERLGTEFGAAVVATEHKPGIDVWARVTPAVWPQVHAFLRDRLACSYFCFLSAIDWLPSPFGKGEDDPTAPPPERSTAVVPGYAGGDTRMQVFTRLYSVTRHHGVFLKVDVPDDEPVIPSIVGEFAGANWHERETWEMFGIRFAGHPQLTKLYLPGDFEGFPLRKDFPLLARIVKPWPGIVDVEPMPGEAGDGEE